MGATAAHKNRALRQKALREQLEAQGHVQHVNDIANKLANLTEVLESSDIQRLKSAGDLKLKLISKYLPDMKAVEHSGPDGESLTIMIATDDAETL